MDIAAASTENIAQAIPPAKAAVPVGGAGFPRHAVMKAAVDAASPAQILDYLTESAHYRYGCSVVGISAPYATAMADDPLLRDAFLAADLLIPDGRGFVWGSRMLGVPCGERLAIPDLCESLLAAGNDRQWKVFLYGGTEEVNAAACGNIARRLPGVSIAGQHGYNQSTQDEDALIKRLKDEQYNLLIVARPSPDKEKFLTRCCPESGVVGLAAGGYADILAGKTGRAPKFVQAIGMEWLYRVAQEPRRLWKRVGWANARFATAVMWTHLRMPSPRPWWGSAAVQVCAVVLALSVAYSRAWNAPYHFDDPDYIQNNPTIRSFEALKEIKVLGFRKLWWLSNAACYKLSELFGNHQLTRPDVRFFRYWNVGCHLIASLALFALLRRVVRSGALRGEPSEPGTPQEMMPFIAAAIFAAHPLCTEAVTYISGRDNGQGGMFYLLGLYAAAVAFGGMASAGKVSSEASQSFEWPNWFWPLIWTMILGGCAVLSKESHLTFPAAVGLLYVFFFRGMQRRTVSLALVLGLLVSGVILAWGMAGRKDGRLGMALEAALLISACSVFIGGKLVESVEGLPTRSLLRRRVSINWALAVAITSLAACSIVAFPYAYQRTFGALTGFQGGDHVRSLFTQAHAVPLMLGRTIVPLSLSIDHDFPSLTNFSDPRVYTGAAIVLGLVLFGLLGMYKRWAGAFGVLLALLVIAPTNSIIERGDIVSERNFYLAVAGGACLIAWLIAAVIAWIAARVQVSDPSVAEPARASQLEGGLWAAALGCCVASLFVSLTMLRNDEWNDAYRLWHSAFEKAPARLRVLYNYGIASLMHKRFDEAEFAFENIIKIGEKKAEEKLFRPDETVQIKCFHLAYANLANVYVERMERNRNDDHKKTLQRVDQTFAKGVERTAYDPDLSFSYANYLFQMQRPSDAERVLKKAYELHPWAQQLYHPLGIAYLETHQIELARNFLNHALEVQETHTVGATWALPPARISELHAFRGLARLRMRDYAGSREDFLKSLKANDSGLFLMLTNTSKTQNPNLKPVQPNPPDAVATRLSTTRRDVLENVSQSVDAFLATDKQTRTLLVTLHGMIKNELERRAENQKKRRAFGFTDDPDDDDIPKPRESRSLPTPVP